MAGGHCRDGEQMLATVEQAPSCRACCRVCVTTSLLTMHIPAMTSCDDWAPGIAIPVDDKGRMQSPQAIDGHPVAAGDERQQLPAGML